MGGEIFVGIRYKDKDNVIKEQCMLRWTNELPLIFMQPSFLEQGTAFEKFLADANPKNEWPQPKLVKRVDASEYGIVLIDFIQHKVFSRNDYCQPGHMYTGHNYQGVAKDLENIYELARRGWLTCVWNNVFSIRTNGELLLPAEFMEMIRSMAFDTVTNGEKSRLTINMDKITSYEAILSDKIFNVDHEPTRPYLNEVKEWMDANGWTSQIKRSSFGNRRTVKWMKPFPGAAYLIYE
jgi:hypothetical protein